jgi:hypothetical protein
MAQIYKKASYKDIQNDRLRDVSEADQIKVTQNIHNFVTYFKAKHLS